VLVLIVLALVGIVLSALYSGLETGVYTINRIRLTLRVARGERHALLLRREMRRPARLLSVLLIGTNAANYLGSFALAELLDEAGLTGWTLIVFSALIVTPILFVFAETLPKELFRTHSDLWTYAFAPAFLVTRWLLTVTLLLPIVQLITRPLRRAREDLTARERIGRLIKEGVGAGVISVAQTTLADRALAMRERRIGPLLIPWATVVTLDVDADRDAREAILGDRNFSRVPIVDASDRVVGIVSWIDVILDPQKPTSELMHDPLVLPPDTGALEALSKMRDENRRIAVIAASEDAKPIGIVTLKDLVEPLTGELEAW
jgi:CBS domain containing-hemolysin-like protein